MGFSVYSIITEKPGITDTEVIEIAIEKKGYVITEDKDLGDELVYRKTEQIGSMLLRIFDIPVESRKKLVIQAIKDNAENLKNCFSVLTSKKLRIRKYT